MKNTILIKEAFRVYDRKMNKIYQELKSVKESYSHKDSRLLMEGFQDALLLEWQWLNKVVGGATKTVSSAVKTVSDVYDKGIELGKKAIDISSELINKVSTVVKDAVQTIKNAPGKFFQTGKELYANIANEIGEMYKSAKEKGGEWLENAKKTAVDMYKNITTNIISIIEETKKKYTENQELFNQTIQEGKADILNTANAMRVSTNENMQKLGEGLKKVAEQTIKGTKAVLIYMVAIPIGLGFLGYELLKGAYELGEEGVEMLKTHIETTKTYLGKNFDDAVNATKEGWDEGESLIKSNENVISNFNRFVTKKY